MAITCAPAFLAIAALLQAAVGDIPYPPNAVTGGTVVALVSLDSGVVGRVEIASGAEPFASVVRSSLAQWRFPGEPGRRSATIVVNFRGPGLFATGDPRQTVPPAAKPVRSAPYPRTVAEPPYPVNAVGEGTVVFRVRILPSGVVGKVETMKGVGSLTAAALDALKSWRFEPARNPAGGTAEADAYAAFVFRSPVLTPPAQR